MVRVGHPDHPVHPLTEYCCSRRQVVARPADMTPYPEACKTDPPPPHTHTRELLDYPQPTRKHTQIFTITPPPPAAPEKLHIPHITPCL